MSTSILFALKDSATSKKAVDYLAGLPLRPDELRVTLVHVFRKPSASETLMAGDLLEKQQPRAMKALESARDELVQKGLLPDQITIDLITDPYPTATDGILDQFQKGNYDLVVIGRKRKSKAEEFVMGDVSVKLVRALEGTGVLVVESG